MANAVEFRRDVIQVRDASTIVIQHYVEFAEPFRKDEVGREIVGRFNVSYRAMLVTGLLLVRETSGARLFRVSFAGFSRTSRIAVTNALADAITREALSYRSDIRGRNNGLRTGKKSQTSAGRGASQEVGKTDER